ncbi:MAG TPA: type II toxin-antitoxin system VapC family toxin [Stellaceae bacterium]|nr:type II toxin-antitoxin system VapC family toxin [Stellaceae bacterium]
MSLYLDTSVIIPLILPDALVGRAEQFRATARDVLIVSDYAGVEFSSVVGRRVRTRELSGEDGTKVLEVFDLWRDRRARRAQIEPDDIVRAETHVRAFSLTLRGPDAIHIAIAQRLGATLVTFDRRMATAARMLGLAVAGA